MVSALDEGNREHNRYLQEKGNVGQYSCYFHNRYKKEYFHGKCSSNSVEENLTTLAHSIVYDGLHLLQLYQLNHGPSLTTITVSIMFSLVIFRQWWNDIQRGQQLAPKGLEAKSI